MSDRRTIVRAWFCSPPTREQPRHQLRDRCALRNTLHSLKGVMTGRWSIAVNGNWRMTFEFRDGNAYVLNYEDYH